MTDTKMTFRRWVAAVATTVVATVGGLQVATAQTGPTAPTETNSGQRPYVVVVMDTSTSMQWTDEGSQQYPKRNYSPVGFDWDPYPNQPAMWRTDLPLGVDEGGDGALDYNNSDNPLMFGSCVVWEPSCSNYERPSWNPSSSWTSAYGGEMGTRLSQFIRGQKSVYDANSTLSTNSSNITGFPVRLLDNSQPRHVTFKEILSGEMVLRPSDVPPDQISSLNPDVYGPGCWYVPRQRDLSGRQNNLSVCDNTSGTAFNEFPDYRTPRPHLQEVWDAQIDNGLMDTLDDQIIFSVAMFDSYRTAVDSSDPQWNRTWNPRGINDPYTGSLHGFEEGSAGYYDYGIYEVVGPNTLDMPSRYFSDVASFVQTALADAGTLKLGSDSSSSFQLDPSGAPSETSVSFSSGFDSYMDSYSLSRQPVSGETPLAAAIYDIQQYFNEATSAIREDPYKQCRPKHVVMMTDGLPLPEKNAESGQRCEDVDRTGLRAGFGLDPDRYGYQCTEENIRRFVEGDGAGSYMVQGGSYDETYDPRVHVVGLSLQDPTSDEANDKLASMARAGKTCAGYYLKQDDPDNNPATPSPWIPDSNGDCPRDDHPCLVSQYSSNPPSFVPYEPGASAVQCEHPALVLQCNGTAGSFSTQAEREDFRECQQSSWFATAFQRIFNQVLSTTGVASRNQAAVTDNLDDTSFGQSGQYRLLSGVRVDGSNTYWKGLMYRETRLCSQGTVDPFQDGTFHDQIADQVTGQATDDPQTNRRVFTSMPSSNVFDHGSKAVTISNTASNDVGYFYSSYKQRSVDDDEFGSSYMERSGGGGSGNPVVVGTRIPFEPTTLINALTQDTGFDAAPFADTSTALSSYFGVSSVSEFENVVDEVRGRIQARADRVLGGIVNSTPATVGPPDADLPIDSYEAYQDLYEDRPTMAYVSSVDGMLHGIHTGRLDQEVMVRDKRSADSAGTRSASAGDANDQREAWAYIPQALHDSFSQVQGRQPNLLDGSPVVKDVRLCNRNNQYNQNFEACRSVCSDGDELSNLGSGSECVSGAQQWRSVLVQGFGSAGSGYMALDVTRPGGDHTQSDGSNTMQVPDPITLWEFTPSWENGQVDGLFDLSTGLPTELVEPENVDVDASSGPLSSVISGDSTCSDTEDPTTSAEYIWKKPLMGKSVGDPAVGTVVMQVEPATSSDVTKVRRPIAVFSGGEPSGSGKCANSGRAIYVVDLQSGTLLRRFTEYETGTGWRPFEEAVTGTPALYNSSPGSLVTRGFVGDSEGRLFRMDFTSSDPADWEVQLFFDPADNSDVNFSSSDDIGPAVSKPALGIGRDNNLVVIYGLGDPSDAQTGNERQAMFALQEKNENIFDSTMSGDYSELLWFMSGENVFNDNEKLTGAPVIFNNGVYFTTYYNTSANVCDRGRSRIYGIQYDAGVYDSSGLNGRVPTEDVGVIDCAGTAAGTAAACEGRYFEPEGQTLIRGLTITSGPACGVQGSFSDGSAQLGNTGSSGGQPQLIAQTGGVAPGGDLQDSEVAGGGSAAGGNAINKISVGIEQSTSTTIPMSWSTIAR